MDGEVYTLEFMRGTADVSNNRDLVIDIIDDDVPSSSSSHGLAKAQPMVLSMSEPKFPLRGLHLDPSRRPLTCDKIIEIVEHMAIYGGFSPWLLLSGCSPRRLLLDCLLLCVVKRSSS